MRSRSKLRADTADMVAARRRFLGAGHYDAIIDAMDALLVEAKPAHGGCVVDIGAGPGYYLGAVLDRLPDAHGLALDLSSAAAKRAARAHARMAAVVCDATQDIPVRDDAAAVVLSVFAPRNGAEIARMLQPSGILVLAYPDQDHLIELRGPLGMLAVDADKADRVERSLPHSFHLERSAAVRAQLSLRSNDVYDVVMMGPAAWHATKTEVRARLREVAEPISVTVAVQVRQYRLAAPIGRAPDD